MHRSVEVRLKSNAIVIDMCQTFLVVGDNLIRPESVFIHGDNFFKPDAEGEDLKATAIGESWARPIHELSDATCFINYLWTRLQVEVISIRKKGLGAKI